VAAAVVAVVVVIAVVVAVVVAAAVVAVVVAVVVVVVAVVAVVAVVVAVVAPVQMQHLQANKHQVSQGLPAFCVLKKGRTKKLKDGTCAAPCWWPCL
jgi:hypothetical protein